MGKYLTFQLDKMKLQTQLLIIISIEFAVIISILIALHITCFILLRSQLQFNSDLIFKQSSLTTQSNVINQEKSYLDKVFFLNGNTLITLHKLYHETKNQVVQRSLEENKNYQMEYAGTIKIPDPIRIPNAYGNSDISYSFSCYTNLSNYDNPKTIDEQIGLKMQEQFQSFGQIIHSGKFINQLFLQTYVIKEKMYTIYPCLNRGKDIYGFHAEQRDWYIEAKRNYDSKLVYDSYNYSFTKPYMFYTLKRIGFAIVMPLVDKELKFIGGLSAIILGKELLQSIEDSNFGFQVVYLVSDEGIMIMHPYKTAESILQFYIYNETITGFNVTDWLQIQSKTGESSCPIFAKYQSSLKCRYNSLYQQEMIVGSYVFEEFNMILIMLQSSQEYLEFYKKFQNTLEADLQWELIKNILIQVGIYIFLSFITYKITDIIFIPIRYVQLQALNMISKKIYKTQTDLPKFASLFVSKQIQEIFQSFKLLKTKFDLLSLHKSKQCQEIEKYLFPQKIFNYKFNQSYFIKLENQTFLLLKEEKKVQKESRFDFFSSIQVSSCDERL